MTSSSAATDAHPVVPRLRGNHRQTWLILPGWGQSAAHWVPVARWLNRVGVAALWIDMAALAASAPGEKGSQERLVAVAELVAAISREHGVSRLIAHSAAAPAAVVVGAGAQPAPSITLVEPVPAHFGVSPPALSRSGSARHIAPIQRSLDELYPFASPEALRQIAVMTGRAHGEALSPASLGDASPTAERASWVGGALERQRLPLRFFRGAASTVCPLDLAEQLCARAPAGSLVQTVERSGHSPHVDRPHEVAELLIRPTPAP